MDPVPYATNADKNGIFQETAGPETTEVKGITTAIIEMMNGAHGIYQATNPQTVFNAKTHILKYVTTNSDPLGP